MCDLLSNNTISEIYYRFCFSELLPHLWLTVLLCAFCSYSPCAEKNAVRWLIHSLVCFNLLLSFRQQGTLITVKLKCSWIRSRAASYPPGLKNFSNPKTSTQTLFKMKTFGPFGERHGVDWQSEATWVIVSLSCQNKGLDKGEKRCRSVWSWCVVNASEKQAAAFPLRELWYIFKSELFS